MTPEKRRGARRWGAIRAAPISTSRRRTPPLSPSFVMRGFPSRLTLFDGASLGFTAPNVDLSLADPIADKSSSFRNSTELHYGARPPENAGGASATIVASRSLGTSAKAWLQSCCFRVVLTAAPTKCPVLEHRSPCRSGGVFGNGIVSRLRVICAPWM